LGGLRKPRTTAPRILLAQLRKWAPRHVRRSCDRSSLTSSAAHSRASGIFPASLKARAFAKAWLSADRSAADSFPNCAPRGLRAAPDILRIAPGPTVQFGIGATNLGRRRFDCNVYPCPPSSRWRCRRWAGAGRSRPCDRGTGGEPASPPVSRIDPRTAHAAAPITSPAVTWSGAFCSDRAPPAWGMSQMD